jgi:hypothetical protein
MLLTAKKGTFTIAWGLTLIGAIMVYLIESKMFVIPELLLS